MNFFTNENFRQAVALYFDRLPDAVLVTLYITVGAVAIGMSLGVPLVLARLSSRRWLSRTAALVISVLRTIPVPPFLYLIYFGVISIRAVEPSVCGMFALGILITPYMAEIYRSGILGVRSGQIEAALALGMSAARVRRRVVFPIALRLMLPAIGAQVIATLLNSSFVAIMGGKDITGMSRNIIYALFANELYFVVALTYLAISYPMSRGLAWLERRLAFQQ